MNAPTPENNAQAGPSSEADIEKALKELEEALVVKTQFNAYFPIVLFIIYLTNFKRLVATGKIATARIQGFLHSAALPNPIKPFSFSFLPFSKQPPTLIG